MRRAQLLIVSVVGALGASVGCANNGQFELDWFFRETGDAGALCGKHGIDAVRLAGSSTNGDGVNVTEVCTQGHLGAEVPASTWHFDVALLDVHGHALHPDAPDATFDHQVIGKDQSLTLVSDKYPDGFVIDPGLFPPECRDGVDNDGDGRVDLDDPDCKSADGMSESPAAP